MPTSWRDGGPRPSITYRDLCWLTDTGWMSHRDVAGEWLSLLHAADAFDRFTREEGKLPAYDSFNEELCRLYDMAVRYDKTIPWSELVLAATVSATPLNWEIIPCARMVP